MKMVLGITGLLQSTVLPALLLMKVCRVRGGIAERLLWMFPLSLLSNYLLIFPLAALHLYTRPVMLVIIAAEITALFLLYRDVLLKPIGETVRSVGNALREELHPLSEFLAERSFTGWIWAISGGFALSGVLWAVHLCRLNFGTTFSGWDTLFSWNRYAEIWAAGSVPGIGGMYPQLIPSNWSLSYLLQGEGAVQFFNTLLPPLFFLMIQLMLFDLGFQRRESGFFFAAVIARYMMKKLMGDQLFDGYMDVPAAAMILLSVYTFMRAEKESIQKKKLAVVLGMLFAAGAAVTKQSGFMGLVLAPLAAFLLLRDAVKNLSRKQKLLILAGVLLIVLPWYLHCFLFNTHGEARELVAEGIVSYNSDYDISHRLWQTDQVLGKYKWVFLLTLIGLPFIEKRYRLLLSLYIWPLTIIWATTFSYDARNLAPVLPFVSLAGGFSIAGIGSFAAHLLRRIRAERTPFILFGLLSAAAVLFALVRLFPDSKLEEDQRTRQKALFGERLNSELLYDFFGEEHSGFDIYTDYPAQFLPGYAECCSAAELTDAGQVRGVLEGENINWMLLPVIMPNHTDPSKELIEQCIAEGSCEQIRCSDGYYKSYCLYRINR
ncbi:MAG: hypothetical protein IJI14_08975 [Anaerolineaceae bacterium]|nr:hypothetical protein [Anaerolineaceae bacterium]